MPSKKKSKNSSKKKKKRLKIIKWTSLFVLLTGAVALFLLSDMFNIKEIKVINNNKISSQEIVELSTLQINENMFKFLNFSIEDKIKQNSYIESANVNRKLNGIIEIEIIERVATYMLALESGYGYINNQGYILEINEAKLELPIITGYTSTNIEPGKRLEEDDLIKLDTVIQILKTAGEKELSSKITDINIEDKNNFIITMESENKKIHFGDSSNINDKFIMIKAVLKDNEGQKGEVFVQNLNKVYFRENLRGEGE